MKSPQQTFHLTGKEIVTEDLLKIFEPETGYQIDRLADCLRKFIGKPLKLVISRTRRQKTAEALGMYFGAIVRATAMDSLNLNYNPDTIPDDYRYYRDQKKIKQRDLNNADTMLRLEWHYEFIRGIDGKLRRLPRDLSSQDNGILLDLIDRVMDWRSQNGYPYIDIEKYKNKRDSGQLST